MRGQRDKGDTMTFDTLFDFIRRKMRMSHICRVVSQVPYSSPVDFTAMLRLR